jgi:hypothetical protein
LAPRRHRLMADMWPVPGLLTPTQLPTLRNRSARGLCMPPLWQRNRPDSGDNGLAKRPINTCAWNSAPVYQTAKLRTGKLRIKGLQSLAALQDSRRRRPTHTPHTFTSHVRPCLCPRRRCRVPGRRYGTGHARGCAVRKDYFRHDLRAEPEWRVCVLRPFPMPMSCLLVS